MKDIFYCISIYTMLRQKDLDRAYKSNGGKGSFVEKRIWRTGYSLLKNTKVSADDENL